MRALLRRVLTAFHRTRAERDLDDEVRFHLQSLADEFEAIGLDAHAARRAFVLAGIAVSAGFVPAWRAVHLDPALTLRTE